MSQLHDESAPSAVAAADQKSAAGSIVAAILIGFFGFLSLLSTGCFGVFAFASRSDRVDGVFLFGMLVMAGVTTGFFLWCRAVVRRARPDQVVLQSDLQQAEFRKGSEQ